MVKFTAIFFIVSAVILFLFGSYIHEIQHQQIYGGYDVESSIHISIPTFYVQPTNLTQWQENCNETCMFSQRINDSIGYNLQPIWATLTIGIFCLLILIGEKR